MQSKLVDGLRNGFLLSSPGQVEWLCPAWLHANWHTGKDEKLKLLRKFGAWNGNALNLICFAWKPSSGQVVPEPQLFRQSKNMQAEKYKRYLY